MSQSNPSTPRSTKSSTITTSSTQSARTSRKRLATYGIPVDTIPWDRDEEIKSLVEEVILQKRDSPGLSKDAQDRLIRTVRAVRDMPESNVKLTLVDLIYPRPEYLENGQTLLLRNHDVNFLPNAIPKPDAEDNPNFQAALIAAGVSKNPKPGFAFGVSEKTFDRDQQYINVLLPRIASVSKDILYPFLVVEGKSSASGGTQYDAENQAARSGAALVHTIEQLRAHASGGNSVLNRSSKSQSAVFSNTVDPQSAHVWVYWCQTEESTGTKTYHMSRAKKH